jgi:poly(A) polymerase
MPQRFAPVLNEIAELVPRFRDAGFKLFLVGGTVRDLMLDRNVKDLDFDLTTDAHPDQIKSVLAGWSDALWTQGERFGTIGAKKGERVYEITTHRAEAYSPDSRKPDVQFSKDVYEDLSRRDFTINSMALDVTREAPELIDPFDGMADLLAKVLRTPLSAEISFSDDPLRMLRAARFISGLGVVPVPDLTAAVKLMNERITIVSAERIRDEFDRLMVTLRPSLGLWFLVDNGLSQHFLPELAAMQLEQDPIHRHKDVLTHTLAVVENVQPDAPCDFRITRLAALFHDVGKPKTRSIRAGKGVTFYHHEAVGARMTRERMRKLKYSTQDIETVSELVALSARFHTYQMGWTDAAVRRYVRDAGAHLADLNVLTRSDCTTRNEKKVEALARRMSELEQRIAELATSEELKAMRPELDGSQVMDFLKIKPGRDIGDALEFLMEIRIEEGLLGDEAIRARLKTWWDSRTT